MKINFVYDSNNKEISNLVENLLKSINSMKLGLDIVKKDRIKKISRNSFYVVVIDDYLEIDLYKNCFKYKDKTLIIVKNISYESICYISKYSHNICYFNTEYYILSRRIYETYNNCIDNN